MIVSRFVILLPLLCTLSLAEAQITENTGAGSALHEWKNADGKAIKGWMLGRDGESVALKLESTGKPAKVPLASLSVADRLFVADLGWKLPKPWSKWPLDIKLGLGDVDVDVAPSAAGRYVYHTRHFEFVSGGELAQAPMKDIARMFEATYLLLQASPWGILAKPKDGRFRAELYISRAEYIQAGGPPQSAGVYIPEKKVFMVPFETLGLVKTSNGWQRSKEEYSTQTLVHELTHMLMDEALPAMPIWLAEGTAEYMERMPMKIGTFTPGSHLAAIKEHHAGQPAFDLAATFTMSRKTWDNGGFKELPLRESEPPVPGLPFGPSTRIMPGRALGTNNLPPLYEAGLMLVYYFIHLDGNGDAARLQRFIAACVKNSERLEAFNNKAELYNKAFEEFVKQPGVTNMGGGRYQFPASMKAPVSPPWPFAGEQEDFPMQDLELLLDGRSVEQVIGEARVALSKAGLPTSR